MPIVYPSLPDPQIQAWLDHISRLQQQRFERQRREHFEGVEREQRDKQLTGLAAGALVGGVAGLAFAPAAATGLTTGQFAIQGAGIGAQAGAQFGGGDLAGGALTAAGGLTQGIQSRRDVQQFGFLPTKLDKQALAAIAVKRGTTPTALTKSANAAGLTLPQYLQNTQTQQELDDQVTKFAQDNNVAIPQFRDLVAEVGFQPAIEQTLELQRELAAEVAEERAARARFGSLQGEIDFIDQQAGLEKRYSGQSLAKKQTINQRVNALKDAVGRGDLSFDQAIPKLDQALQDIATVQKEGLERTSPLTIQEVAQDTFSTFPLQLSDGTTTDVVVSLDPPSPRSPQGTTRYHGQVRTKEPVTFSDFNDAMSTVLTARVDMPFEEAQRAAQDNINFYLEKVLGKEPDPQKEVPTQAQPQVATPQDQTPSLSREPRTDLPQAANSVRSILEQNNNELFILDPTDWEIGILREPEFVALVNKAADQLEQVVGTQAFASLPPDLQKFILKLIDIREAMEGAAK
jgi:hypothetical protein